MKVDDDIKKLIANHKVYFSNGYAVIWENGKNLFVHHLVIGKPPEGLETDHINRDRLDNRRVNLRHVTRQENLLNRNGWSKDGYRGVYLDKGQNRKKKYKAMFRRHGKNYNVGYYLTPQEASQAREKAIARYNDTVKI